MANKYELNSVYCYDFKFNQQDVIFFSEATGDKNPIHLDDNYALNTIFKKRILHGFLGGSVFSKVFGTIYPGQGTIYLKQDMTFLKPMFVDTTYTAKFTIIEKNIEKNRALFKTEIIDNQNNVIITGEALIQHPEITE